MGRKSVEESLREKYGSSLKGLLFDYHHNKQMTVQSIARELGYSRAPIKALMLKYGMYVRGQSEAMELWWARATEEERIRMVEAAHRRSRELIVEGEHSFQVVWREKPDEMREQARRNALKMCKTRKRNGMTGKTGPLHHLWDPTRAKEDRIRYRRTEAHYAWVRAVYERDSYTCQVCGDNTGGNLNAHHIYNHADYPEKSTDSDNGVTLCVDCHRDFHGQYGYGENTAHQFREFAE